MMATSHTSTRKRFGLEEKRRLHSLMRTFWAGDENAKRIRSQAVTGAEDSLKTLAAEPLKQAEELILRAVTEKRSSYSHMQ